MPEIDTGVSSGIARRSFRGAGHATTRGRSCGISPTQSQIGGVMFCWSILQIVVPAGTHHNMMNALETQPVKLHTINFRPRRRWNVSRFPGPCCDGPPNALACVRRVGRDPRVSAKRGFLLVTSERSKGGKANEIFQNSANHVLPCTYERNILTECQGGRI